MGRSIHIAPSSADDDYPQHQPGYLYESPDGDVFMYVYAADALAAGEVCIFANASNDGTDNYVGCAVTQDTSKDIGTSLGSVFPFAGAAVGTISAGNFGFVQIGGIGEIYVSDAVGTAEGAALVVDSTGVNARTAVANEEAFAFAVALEAATDSTELCTVKFIL